MAKHNLFLGTASRSVGDVTLMRRNGVQVSRVRVRKIANPRSEAQSRQRMAFAAVTRFYSPLSGCLEQSYQGLNRTNSLSAYLKENLKRAREMQFASTRGGGFVPMPVQVSRGSMPQAVYAYRQDAHCFQLTLASSPLQMTVAEVSASLKQQYGLAEGDQVTIIYSLADSSVITWESSFSVYYHRFFIDSSDFSTLDIPMLSLDPDGQYLNIYDSESRLCGLAIVFSRFENGLWRRSTQSMVITDFMEELFIGESAQDSFLAGWMTNDATPHSRVYLNGSGQRSTDAVKGWKLTGTTPAVTGEPITFVQAREVDFGDSDPVKVLQVCDEDGNWYYVSCTNTRTAAYSALCPGWSNSAANVAAGQGFDYTSAVSLVDSSNVNLNGEHGRHAVQFLLGLGVNTVAAVDFGEITQ